MSNYHGDIAENATIDIAFSTRDADGAPITLTGGVVSVYKDDDSNTTTGVTLDTDADGVTGFHQVSIDTTNVFYAAGTDFQVVITTGTVDGVSVVGTAVGEFSIENRFTNVTQINSSTFVSVAATTDVTQAASTGIGTDNTNTASVLAAVAAAAANATIFSFAPLTTSANVEIVQFDDYDAADSRAITWTSTAGAWQGGDIAGSSVTMSVRNRQTTTYTVYDGTVQATTRPQVVRVDLASTDTELFENGGSLHEFQTRLRASVADGRRINTIASGDFGVIASLFESTDAV